MMQIAKDLYEHNITGEVFAVERTWSGDTVGSAGPLVEGELWPLAEYEYSPDRNDWLRDNSDKLILI